MNSLLNRLPLRILGVALLAALSTGIFAADDTSKPVSYSVAIDTAFIDHGNTLNVSGTVTSSRPSEPATAVTIAVAPPSGKPISAIINLPLAAGATSPFNWSGELPNKAIIPAGSNVSVTTNRQSNATAPLSCPPAGFSKLLASAQLPKAAIDVKEPMDDCDFHQWAWETFTWATTPDKNQVPRFLSLKTPADLAPGTMPKPAKPPKPHKLILSTRSHNPNGTSEGAGAVVEADGNMMVGPNGYPIYASVHMNDSYFETVKNNLINNGNYQKNTGTDNYFKTGAAVFKATWMRLNSVAEAPAGAFVTDAEVPVLTWSATNAGMVVVKKENGQPVTTSAKVALVGLHVVGLTDGHPEFLWATFEHHLNTPRLPDNQFSVLCPGKVTTNCTASSPVSYTFYQANTPYGQVNIQDENTPAVLTFHEKQQTFSPVTNALQLNKTGGETNSPNGPLNIANLNAAAHIFLNSTSSSTSSSVFANYDLIGTVWLPPGAYSNKQCTMALNVSQANAVGSVNLANSTAETFVQTGSDRVKPVNLGNCFMCHNAQSYGPGSVNAPLVPLPLRRVAISHVTSFQSPYEVQNTIPANKPAP